VKYVALAVLYLVFSGFILGKSAALKREMCGHPTAPPSDFDWAFNLISAPALMPGMVAFIIASDYGSADLFIRDCT